MQFGGKRFEPMKGDEIDSRLRVNGAILRTISPAQGTLHAFHAVLMPIKRPRGRI
jgi:hypothetical protein